MFNDIRCAIFQKKHFVIILVSAGGVDINAVKLLISVLKKSNTITMNHVDVGST